MAPYTTPASSQSVARIVHVQSTTTGTLLATPRPVQRLEETLNNLCVGLEVFRAQAPYGAVEDLLVSHKMAVQNVREQYLSLSGCNLQQRGVLARQTRDLANLEKRLKELEASTAWKCSEKGCRMAFATLSKLVVHKKKHDLQKIKCPYCPQTYSMRKMFEKHRFKCPRRPALLPIVPGRVVTANRPRAAAPPQVLPQQVAPEQAPAPSPNQSAVPAAPVPPTAQWQAPAQSPSQNIVPAAPVPPTAQWPTTAQWQEQVAQLLGPPPLPQTSASPIALSPSILSPINMSGPPSPLSSANGTEYVNIYADAWSLPTTPEQGPLPAVDFATGNPNVFGFGWDGSENIPSSVMIAWENFDAMDFDSEINTWFSYYQ